MFQTTIQNMLNQHVFFLYQAVVAPVSARLLAAAGLVPHDALDQATKEVKVAVGHQKCWVSWVSNGNFMGFKRI
jgi:hypothetical protein